MKLGDFSDPNFRKWVDFRIPTFTDFVAEIGQNGEVNPRIKTIPEIYPGIEEEAVRVGADVYQMYDVVDVIAHEYEFGGGDHMASSRTQLDWFLYQAGMLSFRSFAGRKATWLLNYSWDGDKGVDAREAMKNLAMSQVMAGVNFWDAPGHSMAGSNDPATRKEIFHWIARNEKVFYSPREPMHPVGVYFSPKSRDYDGKNFLPSYRGALLLLLRNHLELQVVTPRNVSAFKGATLILPNAKFLDEAEIAQIRKYVAGGGHVVITGADSTGLADDANVTRFKDCPARAYFEMAQKNFPVTEEGSQNDFVASLKPHAEITVEAADTVVSNIASVDGAPHIFIANFSGLVPHSVAVPTAQKNIRVSVANTKYQTMRVLPFLGTEQTVQGRAEGDKTIFYLPAVERGAVVWFENSRVN